jgi:hypothetical protein
VNCHGGVGVGGGFRGGGGSLVSFDFIVLLLARLVRASVRGSA